MEFVIWLIDICPKLSILLVILSVVSLIVLMIKAALDEADGKKVSVKKIFIAPVILATISVLIPSREGLSAMIIVPKIVNNEQIQEITGNSLKALAELSIKWMLEVTRDNQHGNNI